MKHSNIVLTQYLSSTSICLFPEDTLATPSSPPPPYPWKIIVNCDEEGVLKTLIGKFQANLGFVGGKAGSNQNQNQNLLLEEHEYFWNNT